MHSPKQPARTLRGTAALKHAKSEDDLSKPIEKIVKALPKPPEVFPFISCFFFLIHSGLQRNSNDRSECSSNSKRNEWRKWAP